MDSRIDALLGNTTIQVDLHVAGALELFEDHLIGLGTGVHKRRGDDRQRPAILDVSG